MKKTKTDSENPVPNAFFNRFGSAIQCLLSGWDRLLFRASLRPLYSPNWMATYLCAAKVLLKDFADHARELTLAVSAAAQEAATVAGRPYHYLRSCNINKEQLIERIAREDQVQSGLMAVLSCLEPGLSITVRGKDNRLQPVIEERRCLHFYHYYQHPVFGRCFVRVQSWYPFTVEVCLNGRLWLAKQMDQAKIGYVRVDNCFIRLNDPQKAQALADEQLRVRWPELLDPLLMQAHPLATQILQPFPNLRYYWTARQTEYATDVLFRDPAVLATHYSSFVHHAICTFRSPDVMRFLGHAVGLQAKRVRSNFLQDIQSDLLQRHEGVRIKHRVGANSLKGYDKYHNLFRVESTLMHTEIFHAYRPKSSQSSAPQKSPSAAPHPEAAPAASQNWRPLRRNVVDMPRRGEVSRQINHRYLNALAQTNPGTPLGQAAANLCQPVRQKGKRFRALNPLNPADALLLQTVARGEWLINGFRNRDLQTHLYPAKASNLQQRRRRSARMGRQLRLLRAHGLIQKLPRTHRYLLTERGRQITTALIAAQRANTETLAKAFAA